MGVDVAHLQAGALRLAAAANARGQGEGHRATPASRDVNPLPLARLGDISTPLDIT
jgi:hypothetical protein